MTSDGASRPSVSGNLAYALETSSEQARVPALARSEVLAVLSAAFDLAESQPIGHSVRVAYLATRIAERVGLDAASQHAVLAAGLLHDSGIAVRSTPDQADSPGGHTAVGAWVAAQFGYDRTVQGAIRASHERWDGGGYPDGLAGDDIPVEARIVSCCDTYSAMTTTRSYRAAMSSEDALAELLRSAPRR